MKKHFFSLRERGLFLLLLGLFLSFSSYAQDITVKGVVKDSKFGDPIIGASVLVKGTTNGTISDMDGNFTLAAPKDGTLTISYIGYKSQEIPVNGQQNLNIILDEDVEAASKVEPLEEVIDGLRCGRAYQERGYEPRCGEYAVGILER